MNTTIQKWGNSQGLRLKKEVLDSLSLSAGDPIKVFVKSGNIIISPIKKQKKKVDLRKLLAKVPKNYKPKEFDWGSPVGKEIW
ncbi:MAG TPA: AbrB/MazE/SpoVT family DNA-binding domain-containing protein [Candidatus Yonathbacteria bacterium]|nr:AbrB/MazE/SpoVT family DNA-binding domain-containing protein [Candidatus Yonathbacteria bacterium]